VIYGQESEKSREEKDQKSRKEIRLRQLLLLTHFQAAGLGYFNLAA
jgi:hypothetical protein